MYFVLTLVPAFRSTLVYITSMVGLRVDLGTVFLGSARNRQ